MWLAILISTFVVVPIGGMPAGYYIGQAVSKVVDKVKGEKHDKPRQKKLKRRPDHD